MAVEIREIIIKTQVSAGNNKPASNEKELAALKKQLLEACRNMLLKQQSRRITDKR